MRIKSILITIIKSLSLDDVQIFRIALYQGFEIIKDTSIFLSWSSLTNCQAVRSADRSTHLSLFLLHWLLQQLCHVVDDPGVRPGLGILSVAVVTVITAHADCRVAPVELQVPVKHNLDRLVIKWDNVISYLNTFSHQYYISSFYTWLTNHSQSSFCNKFLTRKCRPCRQYLFYFTHFKA